MLVLYMFVGYKIMLGPLTIVGNGGSLTLSLSLNSRPQIQRFPVSLLFLLHNYLAVKLTELLHIAIDMWFTYVLNMRKKTHSHVSIYAEGIYAYLSILVAVTKIPNSVGLKATNATAEPGWSLSGKAAAGADFVCGSPLNRLVAGSSIFFFGNSNGNTMIMRISWDFVGNRMGISWDLTSKSGKILVIFHGMLDERTIMTSLTFRHRIDG